MAIALLASRALLVAAAAAAPCPADPRRVRRVPDGCPCLAINGTEFGACDAGYVCAQSWDTRGPRVTTQVVSTRRLLAAGTGDAAGGGATFYPDDAGDSTASGGFTCQACAYGQLCPRGSALPPLDHPALQIALAALACPAGYYCPTPTALHVCPPAFFCPPSTVTPLTCNMSALMEEAPTLKLASKQATVMERVYLLGHALQGNTCPVNASDPSTLCPEGYYCPEPSQQLRCPAGSFCPKGSLMPQRCPVMTTCPEGASAADLSFSGFVILGVLVLVLWLAYALIRAAISLNQRRLARQHEAQDRVARLLRPLFGGDRGGAPRFRAFRAVRPRLTLAFENLGLELHDGSRILSGVTGRFEHSRMTAILGPSGAGKSTFLSVLLGKAGGVGRPQGRLLVNGREMQLGALQAITGFVPQEDVVHEDLTVRENLAYSARLRLAAAKPARDKAALVEDCIDLLQLRHVQHQVVGTAERRGISGGQRKRVSIGIELVAKPSLLFMDEPTSGLDSTAAADILGALSRMARLGCTIVAVVHQPRFSIFRMFDDTLLLGKGGRLVYCGPSRLAVPYLESLGFVVPPNENPADFAMDVLSGSVPRSDGRPSPAGELPSLWLSHGRAWVGVHSKLAPKEKDTPAVQQQAWVDPEQLQLLEEAWDREDTDGDGALDSAGLLHLLERLGMEPGQQHTQRGAAALMAELAVPRTGLLPKAAFLQYLQSGGRVGSGAPPASDADNRRRNETLYRVYSIEQYTLASALAELSSASLTPGMLRAGPAPSLAEGAAALHEQQAGTAEAAGSDASAASAGASSGADAAPAQAATSSPDGTAQRTGSDPGSTVSIKQLDLSEPPCSPAGAGAGAISTAPSLSPAPSRTERVPVQAALVVDVPRPLPEARRGLLGLLGLSGGTPLRATPGTAAQYGLLLFRSGIKWARNWSSKVLELLLLAFAAVVCGLMHGSGGDEWKVRGNSAMIFLTLAVLTGATSLSLFGFGARLIWWREQERGVRSLSYFLAATCIQMIDVAVQPAVFLSIYASMTLPAMPWAQLYGVGVGVAWYSVSLGALMSIVVPPSSSLMATVSLLMIAGGMLNGVSPNYRDMAPALRGLTALSYNRWAVELVAIQSYSHFPEWKWPATKASMIQAGYCGLDSVGGLPSDPAALAAVDSRRLLDIGDYCANNVANGVLVLAALGTILRLGAALALAFCPRGLRLEPAVAAVARWLLPRWRRRRGARAATASEGEQAPASPMNLGAGFLSPQGPRDDYARLLASPAAFLPSPALAQNLFGAAPSPAPHKAAFAVQDGRLSFDMLLAEAEGADSGQGPSALEGMPTGEAARPALLTARSASQLELFAPPKPAPAPADLARAVAAKVVAAKEAEAAALVAGVAAKYGLPADYAKAEDTIKAVWAEPRVEASRASSAADAAAPKSSPAGVAQPASQQQLTGGEEPTLADAAKGSSDHMSCDEEAGQQATSSLKPLQPEGSLKRPLQPVPSFSFRAPAPAAVPAGDAALKKRRVQHECDLRRMRELEAQVQLVRQQGYGLKAQLHQAETQHEAAVLENEQLWNALLHIHASLRAAHAAIIKQQVAIHAAAVAAALPMPQPQAAEPSPLLFGSLFSPDADDLAMFVSPAKHSGGAAAAAAANKPRKLFLEEEGGKTALGARPGLPGGADVELSPALWVHAA